MLPVMNTYSMYIWTVIAIMVQFYYCLYEIQIKRSQTAFDYFDMA